MRLFSTGLAAILAALLGLAGAARAQDVESEVIFNHKSWEVRVVAFPDGSIECLARVSKPGSSFSVWADAGANVQLQFFHDDWSFDNETADIVVQIDRRPKWDLTNASLDQNSIHFGLPNGSEASSRFLVEVAQGNRIKLKNSSGRQVDEWSLAGSKASMAALVECARLIREDTDGNPFN